MIFALPYNLCLKKNSYDANFMGRHLQLVPGDCGFVSAQEKSYFVTYDHHLEDPGDLELGVSSTIGVPRSEQRSYIAPYSEFEYGLTKWWTSELYLEGQSTSGDSSLFTGWRLENRFRPLAGNRSLNPVLYLEYENINEASRIEKEIVGKAPLDNQANAELSQTHAHELEGKVILSSDIGHWNVAENLILERNLTENEGFELGYAVGVSRPTAIEVAKVFCRFCRSSLGAGVEFYGGLGSSQSFGLQETAHYAAQSYHGDLASTRGCNFPQPQG